jgi:hypothetical protein
MAQIGGVHCTFVHGHPSRPKQRLMLWRVPGIDGYGAQAMGYNDAEFEVVAVLYSNDEGILLWKLALESMQGTIVTITNDLGITFTRCLITDVSPMRSMAARAAGGITQRGEIKIHGVTT